MSLARTVLVVGALAVATGCSQSPYPLQREIDEVSQGTLSGGVHWQILADQTALKVFGCLEGLTYWNGATQTHEPYCRQDVDQIRYTPIYVERTDSATPFGEAFHRNLTTQVVERGLALALTPENALRLETRVQVVDRPMPVPINMWPGPYTLLGAGVAAIGAVGAAGAAPAGVAADLWANASAYGGAQVLVTTMLVDGARMVMSKTDAYFIENSDLAQYASAAPAADVLTPMKPGSAPPALRTFDVVEE